MTALTRLSLAGLTTGLAIVLTLPGILVLPGGASGGLRAFVGYAFGGGAVGALVAQWAAGLMTRPIRPRWPLPLAVGVIWSTLLWNMFSVPKRGLGLEPSQKPLWALVIGAILVVVFAAAVLEIQRAAHSPRSILARSFIALGFAILVGALLARTGVAPYLILCFLGAAGASYALRHDYSG